MTVGKVEGGAVHNQLCLFLFSRESHIKDELVQGVHRKKNTQVRTQDSEPSTPSVLDYKIPGTETSLVGRQFLQKGLKIPLYATMVSNIKNRY